MKTVPNILADRYASPAMKELWSVEKKYILERQLWIAVLKAQKELGLDIPQEAINAYESIIEKIDVDSIRERERKTRHDVKARIEEFCHLANHELIHRGMTSRDLTENVEQLQIFSGLNLILEKANATLSKISQKAWQYKSLPITARTHNVPAQMTTLGKRFAMWGEEFLRAIKKLKSLIETYPLRGLKGAVGTQIDSLHLFNQDTKKVHQLEKKIAKFLGLPETFTAIGQVYPRSLDFEMISTLVQLASAPSNMTKTLRLMAGQELANEGFAPGQTGSSAMPHKVNCRTCERVQGFEVILNGYLMMASQLCGDEWNEGDVSCSVVRRLVIPDSFFALDGMFESALTILNQLEIHAAAIEQENACQLPFLLTSVFMMEATKQGIGRETAHSIIKEHALAAAKALYEQPSHNTLLERLENDSRLLFTAEQLNAILTEHQFSVGNAVSQVESFCHLADNWLKHYPKAKNYEPSTIL